LTDGELRPLAAWQLKRHLGRCTSCSAELEEVRRLSQALRSWRDLPEPAGFRARIQDALQTSSADPDALLPPPRRSPMRWRRLALTVPATLLLVLIALLLAPSRPANALQETLSAMARVRSAHATGTYISYDERDPEGRRLPQQMRVEYWYQAPDKYRRSLRLIGQERSIPPHDTIISGEQATLVIRSRRGHMQIPLDDPTRATRELSAFSFFTDGVVAGLARERNAVVTVAPGVYRERPALTITLERARERRRLRWVMQIDPDSRRILRADWTEQARRDEGWQLLVAVSLDRFEYDRALSPSLFQIPSAAASPR
jgi:hypothetical protein